MKQRYLEPSICVLLDVLGFSETTRKAYSEGTQNKLLTKITASLDMAIEHFKSSGRSSPLWSVRFFSDNVVVGYPCVGNGILEVQHLCQLLGRYQLTMACQGFFIRGGMAIGTLAFDERIIFGDALLAAHELEAGEACNPRIILDPKIYKSIMETLPKLEKPWQNSFNTLLMRDVDGHCFVNYLYLLYDNYFNLVNIPNVGPCLVVNEEKLRLHQEQIIRHLSITIDKPKVWSKYFWTANYHNSFCDRNGQVKYKIGEEHLLPQPTDLTPKSK